MKKATTNRERLTLSRETLTSLNEGNLDQVAGGSCLSCETGTCFDA